ncbi:MAG: AraC family transcriptional regulator [Pseudonocardia sp.]
MAVDVPRRATLRTGSVEEAHARAEQLMTRHRMQVVRDDEPFAARIDTDEYDGLGVMHFSFGAEVLVESAPLEDFVTVHVPLSGRLRVEHRGTRTVADPRHGAVFSAHGPMTLGWERGLDLFVIKLDRAAVQQRLRDLVGAPPRGPLLFDVAADLYGDGRALAGAVDLARRTFAAAGPAGPSTLVRGELRHAVTTALLLGHRHSHTADVLAPQPPPPPRALRRALELITDGPPLTSAELARQVGVAERTLYAAFRRRFGLSPGAYGRALRLDRVRAELLAGGDGVSVREVAERHGFQHPGRFAAAYRARFGELPSATLGAA